MIHGIIVSVTFAVSSAAAMPAAWADMAHDGLNQPLLLAQGKPKYKSWTEWPESDQKDRKSQETAPEQETASQEKDFLTHTPASEEEAPAAAPPATATPAPKAKAKASKTPAAPPAAAPVYKSSPPPAAPAPAYKAPEPASKPAPAPAPDYNRGYQTTPQPIAEQEVAPSIFDRPAPIDSTSEQDRAEPPSRQKSESDTWGFLPLRGAPEPASAQESKTAQTDVPNGNYDWVQFKLGVWNTTFDARVKSDAGSLKGTDINLSDQLGIGKSKTLMIMEGTFRLSNSVRFWVDTFNIKYQSTARLTEELVFKGQVYKANTEVQSAITFNSSRAGLAVDVVNSPYGHFNIGMAGNYVTSKTSLTAFNLITSSADIKIVIPMITGSVMVYPVWMLGVGLDAAWVGYDKSNLYDITFHLDVNPIPNLGVSLGWKGVTLDVNTSGDKVYIGWVGLYGQLAFRF
ncbi:MAG: hypothetical protein OEV92_12955 [Nitrospinota bacterium]|nr:hypothetical protein [Nitrospinota bacterium]